jgi:dTDP-4-amino-4,6-dideoxygalactose transaminase
MLENTESSNQETPRLIDIKLVNDPRGALGIVEGMPDVGFNFKRFYFITNLSKLSERGGHAHRTLRQCFICLRGGMTITLEARGGTHSFRLDSYDKALIVPAGYWRELKEFDDESLVAVLASDHYDEGEYIRDRREFELFTRPASPSSVPYLDLNRYTVNMRAELNDAIESSLDSGVFIGGEAIQRFEAEFSHYCSTVAAAGVANGYDALQLPLRAKGIGPGDEVIVPAHTFVATALAVAQVGATPVLVDVEPDTGLMDVTAVENLITDRTRAIIPVHLYGCPVDMDPLMEIASRRGIFLLEDAAQAHGALYKGRKCGSLSDAAAFSFYPTKNLGALGDAGAVVSNDSALISQVRMLGNYGAPRKYQHDQVGMNSRLDPLQARILSKKLKYLDEWNSRRQQYARQYFAGLSNIEGLQLPVTRDWSKPVWHVFSIKVLDSRRDQLQEALSRRAIGTNIHYPIPVHRQRCFADLKWDLDAYPNADRFSQQSLSLPLDALHTPDEINLVIDTVRDFFNAI